MKNIAGPRVKLRMRTETKDKTPYIMIPAGSASHIDQGVEQGWFLISKGINVMKIPSGESRGYAFLISFLRSLDTPKF